MIQEIDFRLFYSRVLKRFDLGFIGNEILNRIMAGSERSDDYEEMLKHDVFFTRIVCTTASASLKTSSITGLSHAVVLVGQQHVRDFVLGHTIQRLFSSAADADYKDFDSSAKNIKFALLAEEQAKKIKNDYPGIALAAGYIFDVFDFWFSRDPKLAEFQILLNDVWTHSLRAATIAWAIATHERVFISHRKIIFAASLLHDIGKLALAAFDPAVYRLCIEEMKKVKDENPDDDRFEADIEKKYFDLAHPEMGSHLVFRTRFLSELETDVDFHHDSSLLRTRNSDAFLGSAILNISDRLSVLSVAQPKMQGEDLTPLIKNHQLYFPLGSQDLLEIFAQIRAQRWL